VVEALSGDPEAGLRQLALSLRAGYSVAFVREDEDLTRLRALDGFDEALREARSSR